MQLGFVLYWLSDYPLAFLYQVGWYRAAIGPFQALDLGNTFVERPVTGSTLSINTPNYISQVEGIPGRNAFEEAGTHKELQEVCPKNTFNLSTPPLSQPSSREERPGARSKPTARQVRSLFLVCLIVTLHSKKIR